MDWIDLKLENAPFGALGIKDNYILEFTAAMIDRTHTASDFTSAMELMSTRRQSFVHMWGNGKDLSTGQSKKFLPRALFTFARLHI